MNKKDFPKWIFRTNKGLTFAFRNLRCIEGFEVAVRVGPDGICVFGKNGFSPNFFYMNEQNFASLNDFIGSKGEGFKPYEVGCVRLDGSLWFSDCIYEPGLLEEDYEELKSLLTAFGWEYAKHFNSKDLITN